MELKPVKNYKKPNYAVKAAAAALAIAALSGCDPAQAMGLLPITEETELGGTVPPVSEKPVSAENLGLGRTAKETEVAELAGSIAVAPDNELALEGETSVIDDPAETTLKPPEEIIELEGDVAFFTDAPEVTTSKAFDPGVDLEGGAPVETKRESLGKKILSGIVGVFGSVKKVDDDDEMVTLEGDVAFTPDDEEVVELEGDVPFTPDCNDEYCNDDINIESKELEEPVLMGIVAAPVKPTNGDEQ